MAFWRGTQAPTTRLLEVTVDRCYDLEHKGRFATGYSCVLIYGGSMRRTRPCFGRGTHPVFEEKFVFEFTESVVELNISVLANQTDEVIGFLRVQLQQLLSDAYVNSTWTLHRTDGRPAGYIRLTLQFPNSSSGLQLQHSDYTDASVTTQPPILYQLLPYDALPPPRPTQPNGTAPAALWSQLLPYGSPPPAGPACVYNPTTTLPPGYPLPHYPIYPSAPPGSGPSDIYPPPPC